MNNELIFFISVTVLILAMLFFDLNFNKGKVVKMKTALILTIVWVSISLLMALFLLFFGEYLYGISDIESLQTIIQKYKHPIDLSIKDYDKLLLLYKENLALEYVTGYIIEYSLSIDNIFIIVLIMKTFKVPRNCYHRLLFWGIMGAIVLRFIFIFIGSELIQRFDWIFYVFGALLVFTGVKLFIQRNKETGMKISDNWTVKLFSKYFPVQQEYSGNAFFIKKDNTKFFTPLFLALLVIEFTDLVFAVDSIPAVFAITKDPFIVFFSNIFAILGLRSLFFLLENIIQKFHLLKVGLSIILVFVGLKMMLHGAFEELGISTIHSLFFIVIVITFSILFSILFPKKQ